MLIGILFADGSFLDFDHLEGLCFYRTFKVNKDFKYLDIECTNATEIPQFSTNYATNMEVLNANKNRIKVLGNAVFSNLKLLKSLFLENNLIYKIHVNAFDGLTHLEVLHLNNNYLKLFNLYTLYILSDLKTLWLQNNLLQNINSSFFQRNAKLVDLRISVGQVYEVNMVNITVVSNEAFSQNIFKMMFRESLNSKTANCNALNQSIEVLTEKFKNSCSSQKKVDVSNRFGFESDVITETKMTSIKKDANKNEYHSEGFTALNILLFGVIACCFSIMMVGGVALARKSKPVMIEKVADQRLTTDIELEDQIKSISCETIFSDPSEMQPI